MLVFLRFTNLSAVPIFLDEAIYLQQADQIVKGIGPFFDLEGTHLPVMIWVLATVALLTGNIFDLLYSGRVLSIIFDLLSSLLIYLIGKKLFDKQFGIIASLVYLSLPLNFFHSRFVFLEPLMNLFTVISLYLVLDLKLNFSLATIIVLGFFTKPTIAGSLISFTLLPFFYSFKKKDFMRLLIIFATAFVVILVLFIPISSKFTLKITEFSQLIPEQFRLNLFKSLFWLRIYLKDPVLIFSTVVFILSLINRNWKIVWFGFWAAGIVLFLSFFTKHYYPRLLFSVTVSIAFLSAYGIWQFNRTNRLLVLILITLIFIPLWNANFFIINSPEKVIAAEDRLQYFEDWTSGKGRENVVQRLKNTPINQIYTKK